MDQQKYLSKVIFYKKLQFELSSRVTVPFVQSFDLTPYGVRSKDWQRPNVPPLVESYIWSKHEHSYSCKHIAMLHASQFRQAYFEIGKF